MYLKIVNNKQALLPELAQQIEQLADEALVRRHQPLFHIGFSGGSLLELLGSALPLVKSDMTKWRFYLCDERYVADDNPESNYHSFMQKVFSHVPGLTESQILKANTTLPLDDCAADYERRLVASFGAAGCGDGVPIFDALLLGMGPDGHTCSLFPGHALLTENDKLIAAIEDSPKPPPERITMTYKLINNAYRIILPVFGTSKAEMIERAFVSHDHSLPITLVDNIRISVIVDKLAGISLL